MSADVREMLWTMANKGSDLIYQADALADALESTRKFVQDPTTTPERIATWFDTFIVPQLAKYHELRGKK